MPWASWLYADSAQLVPLCFLLVIIRFGRYSKLKTSIRILKFKGSAICYASANIKFLEILGYAEHICNYVVILDSWFYGKIYVQLIGHKRSEYVWSSTILADASNSPVEIISSQSTTSLEH